MADLEPIGVEAVVEGADNFTAQLGEMQGAIDQTGESAEEGGGLLSGLGDVLGTVGGVAAGVAAAGFAALSAAIISTIGPAAEAEQIEARLDATLRALGDSAAITKDQAVEYANSLASLSTFEDDTILAAETMMLRFTSIGQDIFPQTLTAAADLAAGLGMDLTSAARLLGMALEDPANGMSRLRRMGVMFTEEQQAQIKAMQDVGNAAGAQALMLDILNSKFGGTAAAMADTYLGRMEQLKNTFGNIQETIGGAVIPSLQLLGEKLLAIMSDPAVQEAIASIAGWLAEKLPLAIDFLLTKGGELYAWITTNIVPALVSFWEATAPVRDILAELFGGDTGEAMTGFYDLMIQIFGPEVVDGIGAVADVLLALGQAFGTVWTENIQPFLTQFYEKISVWWTEIAPEVQGAWSAIWSTIQSIAGEITAFISANMSTIESLFAGTWQAIQGLVEAAWAVISNTFEFWLNVIQGDWDGAWQNVVDMFSGVVDGLLTLLGGLMEQLQAVFELAWAAIGPVILAAWEDIKEWFEGVWQSIFEFLGQVDKELGTNFQAAWVSFSAAVTSAFNDVVKWFEEAWGNVTGFLGGINLSSVGRDIVNSLWDGLQSVWNDVIDWWNQNVAPLFGVTPGGGGGTQGVGGGGIQGGGIDEGFISDPLAMWRDQLDWGQSLSGAANFWKSLYKKQEVQPLLDQLDALDEKTQMYNDALASGKLDAGMYNKIMQDLALTEEERAAVLAELAEKQERLQRLQEAQQQLDFLDQQMKLLDLISEYGLNPDEILAGVELGANADMEGILDALTRAMEAVVAQGVGAFDGLGGEITPPGGGAITSMPLLEGAARTVQVTVGPNYINNGMDEVLFAARVEEVVTSALAAA